MANIHSETDDLTWNSRLPCVPVQSHAPSIEAADPLSVCIRGRASANHEFWDHTLTMKS